MSLSDDNINHLRSIVDRPDLSNTKYRLIERIGRGGMGAVYLVEDTELRRRVALKVLSLPDATGDLARRLSREAQIIASLEHPGIVPVHDVGSLSDGRVYYVMKYVQGKNLTDHSQTITTLADRLRLIQRVCEAVAFAHSRGVIHRDLKPANVMIGEFGEVLVMDWGVAKTLDSTFDPDRTIAATGKEHSEQTGTESATAPGTVLGTPAYMSPEQASGDNTKIDQLSDIYSLGGILYSLLTGQYPRRSSEDARGQIISPRKLNNAIPAAVEAICLKAMRMEPRERYRTALELSDDISRFLDNEPVRAHRENVFQKLARFVNRHRFIVLLIAAYVLVRILLYLLRVL